MRCYENKDWKESWNWFFILLNTLIYIFFIYISSDFSTHSTTYMAWHFLFPFSRHFFNSTLCWSRRFLFDILINMEISLSLSLTQLNTQFKYIFIYYTFRTTTQNGSGMKRWIKILLIYLRLSRLWIKEEIIQMMTLFGKFFNGHFNSYASFIIKFAVNLCIENILQCCETNNEFIFNGPDRYLAYLMILKDWRQQRNTLWEGKSFSRSSGQLSTFH